MKQLTAEQLHSEAIFFYFLLPTVAQYLPGLVGTLSKWAFNIRLDVVAPMRGLILTTTFWTPRYTLTFGWRNLFLKQDEKNLSEK
jgi:hypothetical protein